jgi:hypothetical protein
MLAESTLKKYRLLQQRPIIVSGAGFFVLRVDGVYEGGQTRTYRILA